MKKSDRPVVQGSGALLKPELLKVHVGDARLLSKQLPENSVDVTITSPPYFDLKDYGSPNQIGFGQNYADYLADLRSVFTEVFRATKPSGSLWVIVDSFRRNQEVVPLPFDLAAELKSAGWSLRDVIIWKKERTLPWTHKGTTRKIFEYVLVFAKGDAIFKYFADRVRETRDLKRWWVRYPERYNPKGKAIEEIWSYDIPTQGSWGSKYLRHFCPLPADLVSRIVDLTTNENDVVLDPFSGSGTVPTQAALKSRRFIGFELNEGYVNMFLRHLAHETKKMDLAEKKPAPDVDFAQLIMNLRMLKFARILCRAIRSEFGVDSMRVFVRPMRTLPTQRFKIQSAEYVITDTLPTQLESVKKFLAELCLKPPLSKYGIEAKLVVDAGTDELSPAYERKALYFYTVTNSHKFSAVGKLRDIVNLNFPVVSTICVAVEDEIG
jgi:DNA modification methylase